MCPVMARYDDRQQCRETIGSVLDDAQVSIRQLSPEARRKGIRVSFPIGQTALSFGGVTGKPPDGGLRWNPRGIRSIPRTAGNGAGLPIRLRAAGGSSYPLTDLAGARDRRRCRVDSGPSPTRAQTTRSRRSQTFPPRFGTGRFDPEAVTRAAYRARLVLQGHTTVDDMSISLTYLGPCLRVSRNRFGEADYYLLAVGVKHR